jgi:hypothetical protein
MHLKVALNLSIARENGLVPSTALENGLIPLNRIKDRPQTPQLYSRNASDLSVAAENGLGPLNYARQRTQLQPEMAWDL